VVPGTRLDQVVALYDFDRRLKLLVMDAIERIEIALRVELAYTLGARDPYVHKDPGAFDRRFSRLRSGRKQQESAHDEWLRKLAQLQARSKEFPADDVVSLSDMGLPDDWRARLS